MEEKIEYLKRAGAVFFPPGAARALNLANAAFQQMKASVLPTAMGTFYASYGGAVLGDACVFPIEDMDRPNRNYVMPGIVKVNRDMIDFKALRRKTIWGRNQFYWFSADFVGAICMHDVLTLTVLRKYGDIGSALADCLLAGRV